MLKVQCLSKSTIIHNSLLLPQCVIQEKQKAWHWLFKTEMFYMEMEIIM